MMAEKWKLNIQNRWLVKYILKVNQNWQIKDKQNVTEEE